MSKIYKFKALEEVLNHPLIKLKTGRYSKLEDSIEIWKRGKCIDRYNICWFNREDHRFTVGFPIVLGDTDNIGIYRKGTTQYLFKCTEEVFNIIFEEVT